MNYQNIFERYELKYLITKEQQDKLKVVMSEYMQPDKFSKSSIRNIYYDTPDKLLIRRSNEKPVYKEKLRVRSYGIAVPDSTVFVELKKKYKGVVYKRRIDMSEQESSDYLCRHQQIGNPTQITREIDYFCKLYFDIEPSVFISYEREAFSGKSDSGFRMTFDENILFRNYDLSLKKESYGEPLLQQEMVLLEVKTALGIPMWLAQFLSSNEIFKSSFSKYGSAYIKMLLPENQGGIKVA